LPEPRRGSLERRQARRPLPRHPPKTSGPLGAATRNSLLQARARTPGPPLRRCPLAFGRCATDICNRTGCGVCGRPRPSRAVSDGPEADAASPPHSAVAASSERPKPVTDSGSYGTSSRDPFIIESYRERTRCTTMPNRCAGPLRRFRAGSRHYAALANTEKERDIVRFKASLPGAVDRSQAAHARRSPSSAASPVGPGPKVVEKAEERSFGPTLGAKLGGNWAWRHGSRR